MELRLLGLAAGLRRVSSIVASVDIADVQDRALFTGQGPPILPPLDESNFTFDDFVSITRIFAKNYQRKACSVTDYPFIYTTSDSNGSCRFALWPRRYVVYIVYDWRNQILAPKLEHFGHF